MTMVTYQEGQSDPLFIPCNGFFLLIKTFKAIRNLILVFKYSSHSSLFFDNLTVLIYIYVNIKLYLYRTSLLAQWLRLHASTAEGMGSVPSQGTKSPHAVWYGQKTHICILSVCFCTLNIFAFSMLISSLGHDFSDHFDCLSSFLAESLGGIHGDFFRYSKVCLQPSYLALSLYGQDILSSLLFSWHIFNILTKYCC